MSNKSNTSNLNNTVSAVQMNSLWQKQPKANAELFALTYGALVGELVRDLETTEKIAEELDRMGHSIGIRCMEEFLAKAGADNSGTVAGGSTSASPQHQSSNTQQVPLIVKCNSFPESAQVIRAGLRIFLGIPVEVGVVAAKNKNETSGDAAHPPSPDNSYSLSFAGNPLAHFVELPADYQDLQYSQLLAGMVRGMLEMLNFEAACSFAKSQLHGDDTNEITVVLQQVLQDGAGEDYQEE